MRNLAALLFLPLIFSCGGKSTENSNSVNTLENLTYTVDTVVVDSKGEILNLDYAFE